MNKAFGGNDYVDACLGNVISALPDIFIELGSQWSVQQTEIVI